MAMSRQSHFYFFDEPLAGVDPAARDHILQGILADVPDDAVMIISTHLIQDLEPLISDVVFLHEGTVRLAGDADGLRAQYGESLDSIFRHLYRWER